MTNVVLQTAVRCFNLQILSIKYEFIGADNMLKQTLFLKSCLQIFSQAFKMSQDVLISNNIEFKEMFHFDFSPMKRAAAMQWNLLAQSGALNSSKLLD